MCYKVPNPGDETEVPWQLCRPLRILGDLHFKDEQPGKADMSDTTVHTESAGSPLSERERQVLIEYIQTHPQYGPETRQQLSVELADAQSSTHDDEAADSPVDSHSTGPGIIPDSGIFLGTIHRYSNNNNAMFAPKEGSKERNLGDLPRSLENEWTICADYAGDSISLCLTPQLWTYSYREMVRRNLDELSNRTGFGSLRPLLDIRDRDQPYELKGKSVSVRVAIAKNGFGIGYKGPWTVVVLGELVTSNTLINVQLVERYGHVVIARPAIAAEDNELAAGDVLLIGVSDVHQDRIVGTYQSRYIEVPNSGYSPGSRLRIGLEDVSPSRITGTVTAMDESERPVEGDIVSVRDRTLVDYPYVPVAVPDSLPDSDRKLQLGVASVDSAGVLLSVRARRDDYHRSVGDIFEREFGAEECLNAWFIDDGIPIRLKEVTPYPDIPIKIEITGFHDGYVSAGVTHNIVHPGSNDDFSFLITSGTGRLTDGESSAALKHFIQAAEVAATPSDAGAARTMAIIVACEQILQHQGPETAHRYCVCAGEALHSSWPSVESPVEHYVEALNHILRSAWSVERANESTEKVEATSHRADAKESLRDGVKVLQASDVPDVEGDFQPVFDIFNRIVDQVSEDVLTVPTSVKEYRD